MATDGCPKCHGLWVWARAVWHMIPRFSRIPAGTVYIDYECASCGHMWQESYELQDPVATTGKQQEFCHE